LEWDTDDRQTVDLTALFDACVLYPAPLRDFLIHLARTGLFRARWTERIHDEWTRNLIENRPDLDPSRIERTRRLMNEAVLDCLVTDFEDLIPAIHLADPNDQHAAAAAIRCSADLIVTFNLRHFPESVLSPHRIEAEHPDRFVLRLLAVDEAAVCDAVRRQRMNLRKPTKTADELLDTLRVQGLEQTAAHLRTVIDLL